MTLRCLRIARHRLRHQPSERSVQKSRFRWLCPVQFAKDFSMLYVIVCYCMSLDVIGCYWMLWYINLYHHELYNMCFKLTNACLFSFPLQGLSLSKFPRFPHQFHEELVIFYCQRHLINRSILTPLVEFNSCKQEFVFLPCP